MDDHDLELSVLTCISNVKVLMSQRNEYKRECESLRERLKVARALLEVERAELAALKTRIAHGRLDGEEAPEYRVGIPGEVAS